MESTTVVPGLTAGELAAQRVTAWRISACDLVLTDRELRRGTRLVPIEPKPLNLLLLLLQAPGLLVTKEEMIHRLWGGRLVSESVISSCASKLRLALGPEASALLKTVHGYGYRFVGAVECVHGTAVEAATVMRQPQGAASAASAPQPEPRETRRQSLMPESSLRWAGLSLKNLALIGAMAGSVVLMVALAAENYSLKGALTEPASCNAGEPISVSVNL